METAPKDNEPSQTGPRRSCEHSVEHRRKVLRQELNKMAERDENERLRKKEARLNAEKKAKEEILRERINKGVIILPEAANSKQIVRTDIKKEERLSLYARQRQLRLETRRMQSDIDKKFGISDLPKGQQLVTLASEFYTHSGMPNGHLPPRITQELTTEEINDFRMVFDMFDAKNKGYIMADDLKRVAAMLGFTAKKKIFKEMIGTVRILEYQARFSARCLYI